MEVYRITQEQFADDLTGNGSRLFGGRWNSEGVFAVYTSSSRSLALLETFAHTAPKMLDSKNYQLITIRIPDLPKAQEILFSSLPSGWNTASAGLVTKSLGDQFLKNKKELLFAVPSIIMQEEFNYVLNPMHPEMKKVKIVNKRRISFEKRITENM